MSTPNTGRYRFWGRAPRTDESRPPILAEIPAVSTGSGVATLRIYDPIDSWGGYWGISAKEFVGVLDGLGDDVTEIRVHINSPGGEVFEGIAILNALRAHSARIVTIVDGLAASAASFIAMAGDEVVMQPNTELMIHDAWGICVGDAEDMRDTGSRLDQLSDNVAGVYAAKAGGTVQDWRAAMLAETWYSAEEAVTAGLADRVGTVDAVTADEDDKNRFDLSFFNFAGRAAAPRPPIPTDAQASHQPPVAPAPGSITPVASAPGDPTQEGSTDVDPFTDEQLTNLRQAVGVPTDADGATILAALSKALDERAAPQANAPGTVVLDEAQHADLLASAAEGREARKQQRQEQRESLVANAVRDGRIPKARAQHWLAQLEADPGAETILASLAKNTVPVSPFGHDSDVDSDTATTAAGVRDSDAYKNWSHS